ncbi:MAG TPA: magnesium transporter [Vicinamibacterales bacterium]|nr:magnesium transporter [Vicinamibacterales bacterium]
MRVVLSSTALLSFMSVRKAAALAIAQLGIAVFFIAGVTTPVLGPSAPWFVAGAWALAAFVRAVDIESWALFISGGSVGRMRQAFGRRAATLAATASLVERLLLAALACVVVGQYAAAAPLTAIAGWRPAGSVRPEDFATVVAAVLIGFSWLRARQGLDFASDHIARATWIGIGMLGVVMTLGVLGLLRGFASAAPSALVAGTAAPGWLSLDRVLPYFVGLALALPAIGGGDALARAAHELPPPRVRALRRTSVLILLFSLVGTTLSVYLFSRLVPVAEHALWAQAPLTGLVQHLSVPAGLKDVLALGLVAAAVLILAPAVRAAIDDAAQLLQRLSAEGVLSEALALLHTKFGTPARAFNAAAAAVMLVIVTSSGRVGWLSRAYAMAIVVTLVFKVAALVRLRSSFRAPAFQVPLTIRVGSRAVPVGLLLPAALIAVSAAAMVVTGDVASVTTLVIFGGCVLLFIGITRQSEAAPATGESEAFDVLPGAELSLGHIDARPANLLVAVRNPNVLAHVAAALESSRDRDVVVMTVRLLGVDVSEDASTDPTPTPAERHLLSEVVALAERYGRPVRLLVVPALNVFDAIVATVIRLRSSEVHVGESQTLSLDEQARRLGAAWERAPKPERLDVQLFVHHHSGRVDTYHLGAHPPALTAADLDLIHRLWLDATSAIGPHVHHHDVVRAALTQMEQQLNGPERNEGLSAIRQVTRLSEELTEVLHARDYARLRDIVRNRHPGDLAALLTDLSLEDQVLAFRVLPRKDAAVVFEYLSQEAKEALLKAMAQEDVATLLNAMAPDERTMFLEELPASATRQLLNLLTPEERAVALTLLGYPERSVGRLMTPHYVAVEEHWTVREVLDYVREHGQDSETLNVIYVVDEHGLLLDDVRIREFLLAPTDRRVADLTNRQFVALKATDDQDAAVAVFRKYDRTALPVTDSGGMLIGIVTIDDMLDVAEASATREIQRIGGSEAFDEPYMRIAFGRMIQKRAGWLTALFLGEMLTATAMGFFEAEIAKAVVLALFVPLIISSGGNSGSQAATLVIRALALGEVGLHDWWRVMRREVLAGLALGAILGSIGFLRITLWSAFGDMYGPHWVLIALTVALSLVGVVLWGTLTGSLLPFVMRRLGFDPAASSAPFVATLVDVTGLVIYFSVGMLVLRGTLL